MTEKLNMKHIMPELEKIGASINKLVNKVGSETFWPTTMDHECDKASRILEAFCNEGFYKQEPESTTEAHTDSDTPHHHHAQVLIKIPPQVIQRAVGLAVFSVGRIGLGAVLLSSGSGILLARQENGLWSPPSGLTVNTLGFGFVHGIDIYDCVLVINDREILHAFYGSKARLSLGGEASLTLGPVGAGASVDTEIKKDPKATLSYIKSRGLYAGIQLDGTVMRVRDEANGRFYGEELGVERILMGGVGMVPGKARELMDVVVAAEGGFVADVHGVGGDFYVEAKENGDEKGDWQEDGVGRDQKRE